MPPTNPTSTQARKGPIPPRSLNKQHSGSTSNMVDPKTTVSGVKPGASTRKRQAPEGSNSPKKKHKVVSTNQEATENSIQNTREVTPGFEESSEEENSSYNVDEEDDEDGLDLEDNDDFNLDDNTTKSNFEKDNDESIVRDKVPSNAIKPKGKRDPKNAFPWLTSIILTPANRNFIPESNIADLNGLRYCKLKRMRTDPTARAQYGDEALTTATRRANFSRMTLDQLYSLPREKIPKKYHSILDDVIHTKELAVDNELDVFARDAYYPEGSLLLLNKHWRVTEYLDALRSQIPGPRYH